MIKLCVICLILSLFTLPVFSQDYDVLWQSELVGDPQSLYVIGIENTDNDIQPEIVYIDQEQWSDYPKYLWILDTYTGEVEWQSDEFYRIYIEPEHAPKLVDLITDSRYEILLMAEEYPGEACWYLLGFENNSGVAQTNYSIKSLTKLGQNSPNPMRRKTQIEFSLSSPQQTEIKIYNSTGAIVRTIRCGKRGIGTHTINWNGTDDTGKKLPAGTYFYTLNTEDTQITKKAIIIE